MTLRPVVAPKAFTNLEVARLAARAHDLSISRLTSKKSGRQFLASPTEVYFSRETIARLERHEFVWNARTMRKVTPPSMNGLWDQGTENARSEEEKGFARQFPDTSWDVTNRRMKFCVLITVNRNSLVYAPRFISQSGTASDSKCHVRLYRVLADHGPRHISRLITGVLPVSLSEEPVENLGVCHVSAVFDEFVGHSTLARQLDSLDPSPFHRGDTYLRKSRVKQQKLFWLQGLKGFRDRIDDFLDPTG